MRFAILLVCVCVASVGLAGEPRISLQKWTTTDGNTAEAAFQSIDEAAGTVTILVPRTIELDRLNNASRDLAKRLGEEVKGPPPPEPVSPSVASREPVRIEALVIGLKMESTYLDWTQASEPVKVATVGNVLYKLHAAGHLVVELEQDLAYPVGFNKSARELSDSLSKLAHKLDEEKLVSAKIPDVILEWLLAAGLIRVDDRSGGFTSDAKGVVDDAVR